jgi:hypothetical protein
MIKLGATIAAITSAVIALAALGFTIFSFRRQQDRADKQLAQADKQQVQAERFAFSSVRPILRINPQSYRNLKSLRLSNHGLGPAIVTEARFEKNGQPPTPKVVDLFQHLFVSAHYPQGQLLWETFQDVWPGLALPAQKDILLIKQSATHLIDQGMSEDAALDLLRKWQDERRGIRVYINYTDIYGNKMEPLDFTFK